MGFILFNIFKKKEAIAPSFYAMAEGYGNSVYDALVNMGKGSINADEAIKNPSVLRCVELISRGLAMLPLYIMNKDTNGAKVEAKEHYLFDILTYKPNASQTPLEFKSVMQYNVLMHGEAYAVKVLIRGQIVALIPIPTDKVEVKQNADLSLSYIYTKDNGLKLTYSEADLFIVRGLSADGIKGLSKVKAAAEALEVARNAALAASASFKNGLMAGGYLHSPEPRTAQVKQELQKFLSDGFMGAVNAGKVPIVDGFEFKPMNLKAVDAQHLEMRNHQIEEVCRVFGVPRPLLMMSDTSWGSGIEQLSLLFIQYTLAPYFVAWEQAVERSLLTIQDRKSGYYADFDERELLRGSMKDQAEYYTKALGGQKGWLSQDEVRDVLGVGKHTDAGASSIVPAIAIGK